MIRVIVEGLVKRYGQVAAVEGASLEIAPGELFCLLGPSGAGKTVLARLVAGLEDRDDGEIYFNERIVNALPPHERRVGLVFPDFALWPGMTVAENVAYPIRLKGLKGPERAQRVGEILSMLRIDSLAGKKPEQLSRAQALRVALARAVVTGPELLILDEPLEQFDTRGREEVWDEIRRLRGELGGSRGTGARGSAGGHGPGANSPGRPAAGALQSPGRRLRRPSARPDQPASGPDRRQRQRVPSRGGGAHAAGPSGRQGDRQRFHSGAGNARDHFDPSRDPLAGPLDPSRLEPLSRHDRADPLPRRHSPGGPARARRLADHGQGAPEPVSWPPRGPESHPLGFPGVRDLATRQVRGRQPALRMVLLLRERGWQHLLARKVRIKAAKRRGKPGRETSLGASSKPW